MNLEWKKIKEEKYKAGFRGMIKKTFILPDGSEASYDIYDYGNVASTIALTSDNKVIMVRMFRPGPEKIITELPAGFIEEGEDPEETAERELLEETGYSGDFEFLGSVIDDAYSNSIRYTYLAKNCKKVQEPSRDKLEFMEVVEMSLDEFRNHIRSGQITDTESGYMALDKLGLLGFN